MTSLLIRGLDKVATMNDARDELDNCDILIENGYIVAVGNALKVQDTPIIDGRGLVATPGLVNTHHHLFQTLTCAVPAAQDALLFGWLQQLYPIWSKLTPDDFYISAKTGLAELALSGCTLSSDHQYIFPNGATLEEAMTAASDIGMRFLATRGAMSIGVSKGGLPPDSLVERESDILRDMVDVVDRFHDAGIGAMRRVGLAPCSPFSLSRELMRDAACLAREKGVRLHTHLAENEEDIAFSLANFGVRPGQYAEDLGWVGDDVWHAHCVKLDDSELQLFARTMTGIAHCPCSNCRLGSGIAPLRKMRDFGVRVGLGVDGSASNDSGNLLLEARQAMMMQRVQNGADAMSAREALYIATRGGAEVLGFHETGQIAVGKCADIALWSLDGIEAAGHWDPIAALVFTAPHRPKTLLVHGKAIVDDYRLVNEDEREIATAQQKAAHALMTRAL